MHKNVWLSLESNWCHNFVRPSLVCACMAGTKQVLQERNVIRSLKLCAVECRAALSQTAAAFVPFFEAIYYKILVLECKS